MKSWQRIAGILLLIVSAVVIQQSIFVLRLFDAGQPGSGFMPFGLGVILAGLSGLLIATHLGRDEVRRPFWARAGWVRPLLATLITVGFIAGFNWLGTVACVVLLVAGWLLILERKRILVAVFTGVMTGVIVYFLFEVALQAPFPKGALFGG